MWGGDYSRGYESSQRALFQLRFIFMHTSFRERQRDSRAVGRLRWLSMLDGMRGIETVTKNTLIADLTHAWQVFAHLPSHHTEHKLIDGHMRRADWKIWHLFCQVCARRAAKWVRVFLVVNDEKTYICNLKFISKKINVAAQRFFVYAGATFSRCVKNRTEEMRVETINRTEECCRRVA